MGAGKARKGSGFGGWWHTPDDTLDKMDQELLVRDTRVYVHAIWKLLTDRVLLLDYARQGDALLKQLTTLARALEGRVDIAPIAQAAEALRANAGALTARAQHIQDDAEASRVNHALMSQSCRLISPRATASTTIRRSRSRPTPCSTRCAGSPTRRPTLMWRSVRPSPRGARSIVFTAALDRANPALQGWG
jgi:hypothetical protein